MPAPLIVFALSLALLFVAGALQRKAAATILSWWFWIGGIGLWLYCLVVIDALLGVWWLVVGIMLFGVGVYPVALIAALIRGEWIIFGDVGVALIVLEFVRSRAHENKAMSEDQNPTLTGAHLPREGENKVQKAMEEISHRSETQPEPSPEEQHRDWQTNSNEQLESKEEYTNAATFGTEGYLKIKISLGKEPTREQWQEEFLYHVGIATGKEYLLDRLWKDVQAASMEYERLQGRKPVSEVLEQMLNRESPKTAPPPTVNTLKTQQSAESVPPPTNPTKRIIKWAAIVFVASCLFPPWLYTFDLNGRGGGHSRKPAGYYFIGCPPPPEEPPRDSTAPDLPDFGEDSYAVAITERYYGVQIDLTRLAFEWAALAAATGMVWVFVVKPPWSNDDKANRPQKFTPPTGNPEN